MQFRMIDRIVELVPGERITAVKRLRAEEEYLQDHFPNFPVMPGVLMLEALYQASAWLVWKSQNFAHPLVTLKEVRNVKYADFVKPAQELVVKCEITKCDGRLTTLSAQGTVKGGTAVSGRLILESYTISERAEARAAMDPFARRKLQTLFGQLSAVSEPPKA